MTPCGVTEDAVVGVLVERITALEAALIEARTEALENAARAIRTEQRLAEAEQRVAALAAAAREGRRWWQRVGETGDGSRQLGSRIEELLSLAEEQAAEVTASARAEAHQIRSAAASDAAKIREAAV
jgi:hypothetical protein